VVVDTPAGQQWPVRFAYAATAIFIAASGSTNLIYGWHKGTDLAGSLVWASVSVAVSIVFSLSWPALIRSIDAKTWPRAFLVSIALVTTGAYSVSAALGSAMGGRTNAASAEQDTADRRSKAQAAWDAAKADLDALSETKTRAELHALIDGAKVELAKLPSARPVAEVDALIRRAAMHPNRGAGCTAINGSVRMSCPRLEAEKSRALLRDRLTANVSAWAAEIARDERHRSEQRDKAKATMEAAAIAMAQTGPVRIANSDAVALAIYLQDLGIAIDAERVNKLLILVAVLMIECGSGLSLAVALSLSGKSDAEASVRPSGRKPDMRTGLEGTTGHRHQSASQGTSRPVPTPGRIGQPPDTRPLSASGVRHLPFLVSDRTGRSPDTRPLSASGVRFLAFLKESDGVVSGGQRALAAMFGLSKSRLNEVLHELAGCGVIRLVTGSKGTMVQLA
jgi:hypothetical protein